MALLYMGHQISLTAWLPTYLGDSLGGSAGFSGVVLSLFAAGLVAGRVLYAAVSSRVRAEHFLLAATILGSIVLGAGLLIRSGPAILIAMLFTGIFTGALNPVLTSLGCDWYLPVPFRGRDGVPLSGGTDRPALFSVRRHLPGGGGPAAHRRAAGGEHGPDPVYGKTAREESKWQLI